MRIVPCLLLAAALQEADALRKAARDLANDDIEARESATKTLLAAAIATPRAAIPILEEAARAKDREASARARQILDRLPIALVGGDCYVSVTVTASGTPVEGAVVILERPSDPDPRPVPKEPVEMTYRSLVLTPTMVITAPGATVRFSNPDEELHNAHGINDAAPEFNYAVATGRSQSVAIAAGVTKVRCDVHRHDTAWIVATTSRAAAVTGPDGVAVMRVPPAAYAARAWHPERGEASAAKEIKADAAVALAMAEAKK